MPGFSRAYAAYLATIVIYTPITPGVCDSVLMIGDDIIGVKTIGDTIAFFPAGSETGAMWEDNAEVIPVIDPLFGPMHRGFFLPAKAIYAVIGKLVDGKKLALFGHSRGAALAVALAMLFLRDGVKVDQLYAFECPKLFYQAGFDYLDGRIAVGDVADVVGTTNGPDPVPDIPDLPGLDYVKPLASQCMVDLHCKPSSANHEDGIEGALADVVITNWHLGPVINKGAQAMWPA